jgi:hypothetical protein
LETSPAGKASAKAWKKSPAGKAALRRELDARIDKGLDNYLNRPFVAIDSEGRCPLHMIDSEGRTPLERLEQTGKISKYLTRDSSGNYWEDHEISLIGAAAIDRPFGTPIEKAFWQAPSWIENPKAQKNVLIICCRCRSNILKRENRPLSSLCFQPLTIGQCGAKTYFLTRLLNLSGNGVLRRHASGCKVMSFGKNMQSKSAHICISN